MSNLSVVAAEDISVTASVGTIRIEKSFKNTPPSGYIPTNAVYLQSSYPALYAMIGQVNAFAWTPRTSGTTSIINSITYGASTYVAGGSGGVIRTSTDAVTWTGRTSNTTSIIRVVTYQNGLYLYGGDGGALGTSTDGITWNARTSGNTGAIYDIVWEGSRYVAIGDQITTSADGVTWSNLWTTGNKNGLAWSPLLNMIVVTGPGAFIITSTDGGVTWTRRTSAINADLGAAVWSTIHNIFILVGSNQIQTSADGITWTLRATISTVSSVGMPRAVAPWTGSYYVLWTSTNGTIVRSTDGITWAAVTGAGTLPNTSFYITDLNYNPSTGVGLAIGYEGSISRTTVADGTGWAAITAQAGYYQYNVRWDAVNNCWILFGANAILTSTDNGTTWTSRHGTGQMFWAWWTGSYWITSGNSSLNRSVSGATSWVTISTYFSGNQIGIVNDTAGNLYLLSNFNDGPVLNKSTDGGYNWFPILVCGNVRKVLKYGTNNYLMLRNEASRSLYLASNAVGLNSLDASGGAHAWLNGVVPGTSNSSFIKFGTGVGYFNGSSYLTIPHSADFEFGSGDFTIELWVYIPTGAPTERGILSKRWDASGTGPFLIYFGASSEVSFYWSTNGTSWQGADIRFAFNPARDTWHHLAVSRNTTTLRTFFNGSLATTNNISTSILIANTTTVAVAAGTVSGTTGYKPMNCFIDDLRITKGVGRYTANFTPPTQPYPDSVVGGDANYASVSLLLHMDGTHRSTSFVDNSPTPKTVTSGNAFIVADTTNLTIVGTSGKVYSSSNGGITFASRTSGTTSQLNAITFNNGLYIYVGTGGLLATSTDTVAWTARIIGTTSNINTLIYGGGLYMIGGDGGLIATSTDSSTIVYASYNISTEFFVPEVNIGVTNLLQKVYIKAT